MGFVIVASSVFVGIQIGKDQTLNQQPIATQPTTSPTQATPISVTSTTTLTTNPTADWKTYTDSEYKFSFMYPSDWKLNCLATELPDGWLDRNICDLVSPKALLDHGQISNGSYFVVGASKPNSNYVNFTEYLDYSSKQFGYTFKDRQINNISGKIGLTQGKETNYLFERNGHFINANWIYSENSESIDQILSTFKLTN
ncbi:MAG: hypothetical protein ABIJ33_05170 [Patescibacteria group bacterium]